MFKLKKFAFGCQNYSACTYNVFSKNENFLSFVNYYQNYMFESSKQKRFSQLYCNSESDNDRTSRYFCLKRTFRTNVNRSCHFSTKANIKHLFLECDRLGTRRMEMDENELKEEEYHKNKQFTKKTNKSQQMHIREISNFITKGDITSAVAALEQKGTQSNRFVYNIVLRALSFSGELEQCFRLYKKMKEIGFQPNQATYTTLINCCAESSSPKALEKLEWLRRTLFDKQVQLNETHYNAMIKAYGQHGKSQTAFQLADEMCDKHLKIESSTYCSLLHAANSNKESGLKLALYVWHLMRRSGITPTHRHYHLLLRAMRDTKLGNTKVGDPLIKGDESTRINISNTEEPNLLKSPPVLSNLLLPLICSQKKESKIHKEMAKVDEHVSNAITILEDNLNDIQNNNNLILFGGVKNILNLMELDGAKPNIATVTIILEMLPPSSSEEQKLLDYIKKHDIKVDLGFYNTLMKRRAFRLDYAGANHVFPMIQQAGLYPNVATFQIVAMGCVTKDQAKELLFGISNLGYAASSSILATLFRNACRSFRTEYITYLLKYMQKYRIVPNESMIAELKILIRHFRENTTTKKLTRKQKREALDSIKQFFREKELNS